MFQTQYNNQNPYEQFKKKLIDFFGKDEEKAQIKGIDMVNC